LEVTLLFADASARFVLCVEAVPALFFRVDFVEVFDFKLDVLPFAPLGQMGQFLTP
jgi:hypothetical protein